MDNQLRFVKYLFEDLMKNFKVHIDNHKNGTGYWSANFMNKNCGKSALKRKITMIRQELLNLERMLDDGR